MNYYETFGKIIREGIMSDKFIMTDDEFFEDFMDSVFELARFMDFVRTVGVTEFCCMEDNPSSLEVEGCSVVVNDAILSKIDALVENFNRVCSPLKLMFGKFTECTLWATTTPYIDGFVKIYIHDDFFDGSWDFEEFGEVLSILEFVAE